MSPISEGLRSSLDSLIAAIEQAENHLDKLPGAAVAFVSLSDDERTRLAFNDETERIVVQYEKNAYFEEPELIEETDLVECSIVRLRKYAQHVPQLILTAESAEESVAEDLDAITHNIVQHLPDNES